MKNFIKSPYLHVKIAGGATAQCLGLMNAIYASKKIGKPFKISYYPYSTGTFWPFAIRFLLNDSEILNLNLNTKGLVGTGDLETGKIIKAHPLFKKGFSYEKLLSFVRIIKLESKLQFLRRELAIQSSQARLIKINNYYKVISGGYARINEQDINLDLNERFEKAGLESPFKKVDKRNLTIIHYRLGDKKSTPMQMKHTKDFNTDLIIDPATYLEVLENIKGTDVNNIYVVSDEPKIAQQLLANVGVKAKISLTNDDIWQDIRFMAQANVFIGSKSQVSQLANIFIENNGGRSFMLNLQKPVNYYNFKNTTYVKSKFLQPNHRIYNRDIWAEAQT